MKNVVFDGVAYAAGLKIKILKDAQAIAWERGRKLKLAAILNPDVRSARVYTGIKRRRALELEIDFEKSEILGYRLHQHHKQARADVEKEIVRLNADESVDGILIQLPLGSGADQELCDQIAPAKDVDGLGKNSKFVPATVKAVMAILEEATSSKMYPKSTSLAEQAPNPNEITSTKPQIILVVGNRGVVGKRLQRELGCEGMDKDDFDAGLLMLADVVIACTGQEGLITGDMVKDPPSPEGLRRGEAGLIAIDVGWPRGDFEFASVMPKASFITPVPGGVGPVTVMKLFENLVQSAQTAI